MIICKKFAEGYKLLPSYSQEAIEQAIIMYMLRHSFSLENIINDLVEHLAEVMTNKRVEAIELEEKLSKQVIIYSGSVLSKEEAAAVM